MLTNLIAALKDEQSLGTDHANQIVERIDAHIRDLEQLKTWILDSARARSLSFDGLISGGSPELVAGETQPD